jgi:hypothetical protein
MTTRSQAGERNYVDVSAAVARQVSAQYPGRDFDFTVEFLDRATAQLTLVITEGDKARRVDFRIAPETREDIFRRRKHLCDQGGLPWRFLTISQRSGCLPAVKVVPWLAGTEGELHPSAAAAIVLSL